MRFARLLLYAAAVLGLAVIYHVCSIQISRAQEIEQGAGVICDTPEQTARFLEIVRKDASEAAMAAVNAEFSSPNACVAGHFAYVKGEEGARVPTYDGDWRVTAVLVVAVATPNGWMRIVPHVFYTAFKVDERGA